MAQVLQDIVGSSLAGAFSLSCRLTSLVSAPRPTHQLGPLGVFFLLALAAWGWEWLTALIGDGPSGGESESGGHCR